jgi:ABC-type nitrate/sulfonate/bicarbonate transport system substrate-binding protein
VIAGRLATINSPVRLTVVNSGDVIDAGKAFAAGTADLAVVRADLVDPQLARTVAVMAHGVVMIVAPPGSNINSIAKLRDHSVGVVGGDINHGIVEALKKEYDLDHANVVFRDIARRMCAARCSRSRSALCCWWCL